jgi:hypothetical protein
MAGKCPPNLEQQFIADVRDGLTNQQLAEKHGRVTRTIRSWKRKLREAGLLGEHEGRKQARAKRERGGPEPPGEEGISFEEEYNYAQARATTQDIHSVDQLIEVCGIDLEVWQVKRSKINVWQVGAKEKHSNLTYEKGKVDGWIKQYGLHVHDLWQVWAEFIRRVPVAVKPVIHPVACPVTFRPGQRSHQAEGRAMLLADPQFGYEGNPPRWRLLPFHDRAVLDVVLQLVAVIQPDVLELLGDFLDWTVWQDRFAVKPGHYYTTQPAIDEGHWWLRQFVEASPDSERRLHSSNHSERVMKSLAAHLQEAYHLRPADRPDCPPALSPQNLLGLDALGIEWIEGYPEDRTWLGEAMQVRHGHIARQKPFSTVTELLKQGRHNQACGHIHRDELVSEAREMADGQIRTITAYCPGCLCHIDGRVPGPHSNWRQGIGVVDWAGEDVSIYHIPIRHGRAIWDGRVYEARDRMDDLRADLPDYNW